MCGKYGAIRKRPAVDDKLWKDVRAMLDDFALFEEEEVEEMKRQAETRDESLTDEALSVIIVQAKERAQNLRLLRQALMDRNEPEVFRLGRLVCGLPTEGP